MIHLRHRLSQTHRLREMLQHLEAQLTDHMPAFGTGLAVWAITGQINSVISVIKNAHPDHIPRFKLRLLEWDCLRRNRRHCGRRLHTLHYGRGLHFGHTLHFGCLLLEVDVRHFGCMLCFGLLNDILLRNLGRQDAHQTCLSFCFTLLLSTFSLTRITCPTHGGTQIRLAALSLDGRMSNRTSEE